MPELEPITQPINTAYNPAGMASFLTDLGMVGTVAMLAVAGIAAVAGATVSAVQATIEWGLQLDDVMDKIGGTTEEAAGLKVIADAVGMSVEDATRGLNLMGKNLENVDGKIGTAGKALDELGIAFKNSDGTFRSSMDIFKDVADVLGAMPDGITKTRYEMEIFGRSGAAMNDMLRLAAGGGMQQFIDQAKAMGLALSGTQVNNIEHLSESMNIMKDQFTGIAVILGSAFIPAAQGIVTWIGNMVASVTPAIQHFGEFLGILLDVKGASGGALSAATGSPGAGMSAPTGYTELINYNFWAGQPHPAGAVNPYGVSGGGGGAGGGWQDMVADRADRMGESGFRATGFELAVKNFVDGIKAVNWQQVGKDFNAAGAAVKEAIKFANDLIHPTLGLAPGGESANMFGNLKEQQVTIIDGIGKKISDFFAPKFTSDEEARRTQTLNYILQQAALKDAINKQATSNDKINTTLTNLPGNIRSALATVK